jgi:hypothetical protein
MFKWLFKKTVVIVLGVVFFLVHVIFKQKLFLGFAFLIFVWFIYNQMKKLDNEEELENG